LYSDFDSAVFSLRTQLPIVLKARTTLKFKEKPDDHSQEILKDNKVTEFFKTFISSEKGTKTIPDKCIKELVDLAARIPVGEEAKEYLATFKRDYSIVRLFWYILGLSSLLLKDNAGLVGRLFKAYYLNDISSTINRRILAAIISERMDDKKDILRAFSAYLLKKGQIYKELAIKSISRTL
jgi:hypothetical protein